MTTRETQIVDAAARVVLPRSFAKSTVTLEEISETEVRICKTGEITAAEQFPEETITILTDRDRDRFLQLIENPPAPNAALLRAASEIRNEHG